MDSTQVPVIHILSIDDCKSSLDMFVIYTVSVWLKRQRKFTNFIDEIQHTRQILLITKYRKFVLRKFELYTKK